MKPARPITKRPSLATGGQKIVEKTRRIRARDIQGLENLGPLQMSANKEPCRWTLESLSFSIFLPIERLTATEVALECCDGASDCNWSNVFVECDETLSLCDYRTERAKKLLTTRLPARPGAAGAILRFHLQETRKIKRAGNPGSAERLGLCLTGIRISAAAGPPAQPGSAKI